MPDVVANNPFTQVYNALWTLVNAHPDIGDKFKTGNRITFGTDDREPFKRTIAASDVPELVLTQDGGPIEMYSTSSTTKVTRDYSWLVSTGDFRINHFLNDVEWMLFVAHLGWKTHLTSLQYNSNSFVKRCEIIDIRSGISDAQRNRGLNGWSTVWKVRVEMHFKTSDLKEELSP